MRYLSTPLFTAAFSLTLAACADAEPARSQETAARLRVFKPSGPVQCGGGGGVPVATLARQLTDAGLKVLGSACGTDGRMHAAMCGAADGRIVIFELSPSDAQAALKLDFAPLANLPQAQVVPCS